MGLAWYNFSLTKITKRWQEDEAKKHIVPFLILYQYSTKDARANVNLLYYSDWWRSLMYQGSQRDRKRHGTNTTDSKFYDSSLRALMALLRIWDSESNRLWLWRASMHGDESHETTLAFVFDRKKIICDWIFARWSYKEKRNKLFRSSSHFLTF